MSTMKVTPAMAIEKLVAGLRAIPDNWTLIGHRSNSVAVVNAAAKQMVAWGRGLASELEAMPVEEAAKRCGDYHVTAQLANLDPHGLHIGKWAHIAATPSIGWSLVDGVLCS